MIVLFMFETSGERIKNEERLRQRKDFGLERNWGQPLTGDKVDE
jgi:hypothetical protein